MHYRPRKLHLSDRLEKTKRGTCHVFFSFKTCQLDQWPGNCSSLWTDWNGGPSKPSNRIGCVHNEESVDFNGKFAFEASLF